MLLVPQKRKNAPKKWGEYSIMHLPRHIPANRVNSNTLSIPILATISAHISKQLFSKVRLDFPPPIFTTPSLKIF